MLSEAEVLAFSGIAGLLPQAIIGPFVGVFIDRWDRKKVMIYSDVFIAIWVLANKSKIGRPEVD